MLSEREETVYTCLSKLAEAMRCAVSLGSNTEESAALVRDVANHLYDAHYTQDSAAPLGFVKSAVEIMTAKDSVALAGKFDVPTKTIWETILLVAVAHLRGIDAPLAA